MRRAITREEPQGWLTGAGLREENLLDSRGSSALDSNTTFALGLYIPPKPRRLRRGTASFHSPSTDRERRAGE